MRLFIFSLLATLTLGSSAFAQDYGLLGGLSESSASSTQSFLSNGSYQFGFRVGGVASFTLSDSLKFRSGLLYSWRHFELKDTTGAAADFQYEYLDIPFLLQFNFSEGFGVFGGIVAAVNVNNSSSGSSTGTSNVTSAKSFIPLAQVGISGTFDNMYSLEAYYELGIGDIATGANNFSVFGLNFIYWL